MRTASRPTTALAVAWCLIGAAALVVSLWWRLQQDPPPAAPVPQEPVTMQSAEKSTDLPDPLVGLPAVDVPVSDDLRIIADRSQGEHVRLKPLVDGTVVLISQPQDVALIRRILRDPNEGDTIRNEAANLLTRSEVPSLADDLIAVLAHPAEEPRFRSFAMQHMGVLWLQQGASAAHPIHARLVAGLQDRHVEVRREALLPLARGGDERVPAHVETLLGPAGDPGELDLACRLVADLQLTALLPAVRDLLKLRPRIK